MATRERRNIMPLDQAYYYLRALQAQEEKPALFKLVSGIATIDAALKPDSSEETPSFQRLSRRAWSQVRNSLFDWLVRSFSGYFVVYDSDVVDPVDAGERWPESGVVEFYPERARRREDSYSCALDDLYPDTQTVLRWCFAEGRQQVNPSDFPDRSADDEPEDVAQEAEATVLLERLYEVCVDEAVRGKKRAHEKWWQLYWEANSCRDKQAKHELNRKMSQLQSVWGRPS